LTNGLNSKTPTTIPLPFSTLWLPKAAALKNKYIGEEWSLPKQTVSGTCKTLAEQGLLTFHESEQDKRERLLSLTEQGKESATPLVQNMQEFSKRIFTAFGEKRAARLFADLDALAELMAQTLNTK